MKRFCNLFCIFPLTFILGASVDLSRQPDKPKYGQYEFPMEIVWQTKTAGDEPFGLLAGMSFCDDGTLVCRDMRLKRFHVYSIRGEHITTFGELGEGPGQIKDAGSADLYASRNQIIIHDGRAFKYFDTKGRFLRQIKRPAGASTPALFLDPTHYISAPNSKAEVPGDGLARILRVDIESGKIQEIGQFSAFEGGTFREGNNQAVIVIPSITPVLTVGRGGDTLFFGSNDRYVIQSANMNGQVQNRFGIVREPIPVSVKEREDVLVALVKGLAPEEAVRPLAKRLPDIQTQFTEIRVINDLIYVNTPYFAFRDHALMDIFSAGGEFLYRGIVRPGDELVVQDSPVFHGDHFALLVQDEEGDQVLMMVKTKLPKPKQ